MLICRNAEGVHGKSKVGNPCPNVKNESSRCKVFMFVYFLF